MKIGLSEKQYKTILTYVSENQEVTEDEEVPSAEPESGTSSQQSGGQGYPEVGKWESGVTRGPANQVGVTKWADVVGSTLKRGKSNQLKENEYTKESFINLIEQLGPELKPWYNPINGKLLSGMMKLGEGGVYAKSLYPNIKDGKYPPTAKIEDIKNFWLPNSFNRFTNTNDRLALGNISNFSNDTQFSDALAKYSPTYWKGKPQPKKPTPFNGQIVSTPGSKLPKQPWGYYEGKLGNLETQVSQFETDFTNWLKANDINQYYNMVRKTPKGLEVPKGYSPLEYDEYRSKIDPIVKQIESLNKVRYRASGWMDNSVIPLSKEEQNKLVELRKQRDKINNEYYNADFPDGITKEEKKQLEYWKQSINMYYDEKKKQYNCEQVKNDRNITISQDKTRVIKNYIDICKEIEQERISKLTNIKQYFKYDPDTRTKFDKWWDEYGLLVQIGGSILITILAPEIGIPMNAARIAATDAAFNLTIAAYQLSRDKKEDAAASVLFAILPQLKIFKVPTKVADSISKKLATANIRTSLDLSEFITKTLTAEEQKWFTAVLKGDKSLIEQSSKNVVKKTLENLEKNGVKVTEKQVGRLNSKWSGMALDKVRKLSPTIKLAPKMTSSPKFKQIVFELGVFLTATQWINAIEEKAKIELDKKQEENLIKFFDSIPEEIRKYYTEKLTGDQLQTLSDGNVDLISDVIDEVAEYLGQINDNTGKPFTKEEWEEHKIKVIEAFRKEVESYNEN
jgi:hypothetical protein